jgi:methylation protein EvaC
MSFGKMPIANGFLLKNQVSEEFFFNLNPAFCEKCFSFQIEEQPDPKTMFHENYAFFSRQSKSMRHHFKSYSEWIIKNYIISNDPFIIELGSNDGILLENFVKENIRHLGIEPSANVALEAKKYGVNSIVEFFNQFTANKILNSHGKVDIITASNVMCHIPDLNDIIKGIDLLLNKKGVLIFEDPYLGDMITKVSYDQIYDEHVYIFSAISVRKIFDKFDFEIIDLLPQDTHGGSMRYVLGRKNEHQISEIVNSIMQKEFNQGLHLKETYINFKKKCEKSKFDLLNILINEKNNGKKIAAYGATSKSTTILNYCRIGTNLIEYISDTTPIKQNKLSPGMHIPVKPYEDFKKNPPDVAVLFAWNHAKEIMAKEEKFMKNGGKWIVHVPEVKKF